MHQPRYLLALLIIALLSTTLIGAAQPQTAGATDKLTLTLADLGYTKDQTLIGIHVDRIFSVRWPSTWKPGSGNTATINFSHSKALDTSSSFVVDWNGTRLGSTQLDQTNDTGGSLTVQIPENLIQPGYNELRLEFYMGIHNQDFCQDQNNPNIWATIHSASTVNLAYSKLPVDLNLGLFPYPFVDNSDLIDNTVTFVVPNQPQPAELQAVAAISAKLGQAASYRTLNLDAIDTPAGPSGNLIYVGLAQRLPVLQNWDLPFVDKSSGKVRLLDPNKKPLADDTGLIWEQATPGDDTSAALIVTGSNEAGLLKAAQGLTSDATFGHLNGPLGLIRNVPAPVVEKVPTGQELTFQQLGYDDTTARGVRDQTMNFVIPLSLAWQIQSEIVLDVHFAHSSLLDDQTSSLNIVLNGSPVSNILLTKDNANDAWATFQLPSRLFKIGDNRLTVSSTINLQEGYATANRPGTCGNNYEDEAWAVLYSDSKVTLPPLPPGMAITLADYPYAYTGDTSLSQLALVVPDQAKLTTARAVAQVAGRLGRYTRNTTLAPQVLTAQKALASANPLLFQILIGVPLENGAIQKINDDLPAPFQPNTNQLKPNEKLPQVVSLNGSTGYLEVSQDKQGSPRLVIAGTNDESLLWAAGAVSTPKMLGRLKGDVAVLDSSETMVTTQIRENKPPVAVAGATVSTDGIPQPIPWVMWATYAVLGVTLLIIFIVWIIELIRRRHTKRNYEIHS